MMLTKSDKPTLIDLLQYAAETNPEGLCISMDGHQRSFSELFQGALTRAKCLVNLGAQKGDKVGILMPNSIEYLEIFYGAILVGCVPVTINNRYKVAELKYVLSHGDVKFLFTSAATETNFLNTLKEAFTDLNLTQSSQE
ncbi:MAG: AMP-binding protein, partial [Alphaproteobacteria bacterium]|nr:AMP-binding protein [Alphaproteobacteria bacterium]